MITRDDIPIGTTRDAEGLALTYKDSNRYWYEHTYDAKGLALTRKDSHGFWSEHTYDADGWVLTFKTSNGLWREHTYDADGRVLTHKQEGFSGVRISDDGEYVLFRDAEKELFLAGCRLFARAEALKHWDRDDERAIIFTKAIREAV